MPKRKEIKNVGASVRARLTTLSRTSGQPFDLLLTRFAIERLLYRLAASSCPAFRSQGRNAADDMAA